MCGCHVRESLSHTPSLRGGRKAADEAISKPTLMKTQGGYIYLLTNKDNRVIYTGVTSDLQKRVYEHREGLMDGFTKKYNVRKLLYYEAADNIEGAIAREKQIKAGSRKKKIDLIKSMNPTFKDLYSEI